MLYLSANMRSVLLPADTKAGTVIYRLRASDADDQYPISFGVVGENSNYLEKLDPFNRHLIIHYLVKFRTLVKLFKIIQNIT